MFKSLSRTKSLKSPRALRGDNRAAAADQDPVPARHGPGSRTLDHEQTGLVHVSDNMPHAPTKQIPPQNLNAAGSPSSSHLSSSFSVNDGSNAYVSRPLPQPPSRPSTRSSSRQTTAERPSTSAGPATGSSRMPVSTDGSNTGRPNTAHKRGSRDDFHINTQSTRSFRSYHIPIQGKPPSPSGSLRSAQFPDATIAVRTQTPDSMIANNPAAPIGMAIGSPGFPPPARAAPASGTWQPQLRGIENRPPWEEPPSPAPTRKPSKWRLFGRLGGKKSESKERRATTPDLAATPLSESRPKTSSGVTSRDQGDMWRSNTIAGRKAKKIKPIIVRSQTESAVETTTSSYPKEPKPPKTPKTPKAQKAPALVRRSSTKSLREGIRKTDISPPMPFDAPPMPPIPMLSKGGFLDVDIPNVKLDRYSVMFDGILRPQGQGQGQGQGPSNPRNSVFARRQAMKKLQTIEDAIMEEEVRVRGVSVSSKTGPTPLILTRESTAATDSTATTSTADTQTVTVPVPASAPTASKKTHTKSPSFSLFPAPPNSASGRGRMTPVGRSNTTTAEPHSPSMTNFDQSEPFPPPPRIRSDTPESRTPSQMSQQSQDIPIAIEGDVNRGRQAIPYAEASRLADNAARLEQRGVYGRDRSLSSSRSTQLSEQVRQARETSQSRQGAVSHLARVAKPAPLNISRAPRPTVQAERQQVQEQARDRSRSGSRTRIPQPVQASHQSQQQQQSSFRQDQSTHLLDAPTDTTRGQATIQQRTMPPEPVWQILSPPTSSVSSNSTSNSSRKRSPSSASSTYTATSSYAPPPAGAHSHSTSQAAKPPADNPEMNLKSAVEVSIARQISISRQQRNLLQNPARSRPWMRADATPAGAGSTARARQMEAENERVGAPGMARPMHMSADPPTAYLVQE